MASVGDAWDEDTTGTDTAELTALPADSAERKRPCLTVLTGTATGQMFKLPRGEAGIGRAQDATVRLLDDGVSRQHARLRLETDQPWVEDLGSRNGTFVNGARIRERTRLKDGDKIQVAIIATNKLDDSFDASAAIAGPDLFLRGGKNLYCIGAE